VIVVNVARTWTPRLSVAEEDSVIGGDWPQRAGSTWGEVEPAADVLVAVRRNRFVAVRGVRGLRASGERIRFDLDVAPAWMTDLLGCPCPPQLVWRRGEVWPIRIFATDAIKAWLDEQAASAADPLEREAQTETIGLFTVTLTGHRQLQVLAPRGCDVVVRSAL
jgi:hypothetical protein